jgi:hypothetical protein
MTIAPEFESFERADTDRQMLCHPRPWLGLLGPLPDGGDLRSAQALRNAIPPADLHFHFH